MQTHWAEKKRLKQLVTTISKKRLVGLVKKKSPKASPNQSSYNLEATAVLSGTSPRSHVMDPMFPVDEEA